MAYTKILATPSTHIFEEAKSINVSGVVNAIATDNNYVYIGGSFSSINTKIGTSAFLTNTDASRVLPYPKTNGQVFTAEPDGSGGWFIGGSFTRVGETPINAIAHITSAGTLDTSWNANMPEMSQVRKIVKLGSSLYVGGSFISIGGISRNHFAKINSSNAVGDPSWNSNSDGIVTDIIISGSDMYVIGDFGNIGGQSRGTIAKLNLATGLADPSWNPNPDSGVSAIFLDGSYLYVGGYFSTIGGQTEGYIARLSTTTGDADPTWNPNANNIVLSIFVSGTSIYAGGGFFSIGGLGRNYIAKLNNTNGLADGSWNPNANALVRSIYVSGSDIYAGGDFTAIGGQTRNYVAKLNNTNGNADTSWNPSLDARIWKVFTYNSNVFIGGQFNFMAPVSRNNLVRFNKSDMTLDTSWNPNPNGVVKAIALLGSDVYVGGSFSSIGGIAKSAMAKLDNSTASASAGWGALSSGTINTIQISGTDVYVGGTFDLLDMYHWKNLARESTTNGNFDTTWLPNPDNEVKTIAISGSNVFAGGAFTNIGGQAFKYLAKLNNTDGNADASWNPNPNNIVNGIAVSGNDLYVGGSFTNINSQTRNFAAKVSTTTGANDATWDPNAGNFINVISIDGSDIYVGGNFTTINGQTIYRVAKLNNLNGSADLSWSPNSDGIVYSLLATNSNVYVGGLFSNISNQRRYGFAYYPPASTTSTITSGIYTVSPGSSASETISNIPYGVSKSVFLSNLSKNNIDQSWDSSNLSDPVISNNTLVVTAEDGVTKTTYSLAVSTNPDTAAVATDKDSLTDALIKGANSDLSNITLPLTFPLPYSGANGTSISWTSSNNNVISDDGQIINRPVYGSSNTTVNFTATISKGSISDTKVFVLTILSSEQTTKQINSFIFASPSASAVVNQSAKTVTCKLPFGTNLSNLVPSITISGSSINPASGAPYSFSSPATYTVTAADASTQAYTVTCSTVNQDQTVPDSGGNATVTTDQPQVVVTDPYQEVNITITDGTTNPSIYYPNLTHIPATTIRSGNIIIYIPPYTVISGEGTPWDSQIVAPQDTLVTLPSFAGYTGSVDLAKVIGSISSRLTSDKAIKIQFIGASGKRVGYSILEEPLTEISTLCAEDSQSVGDALASASDCKINIGSDLIVWTKHFTRFALFSETPNSNSSSNNGGGGGGGGGGPASPPRCENRSPLMPVITSIKFVKRGTIKINWNSFGDNISSWTVAYGLKPGEYIYGLSDFGDSNSRSIDISNLQTKKYYLSVRANNGCQPGPFSAEWQVSVGWFGVSAKLTPVSLLRSTPQTNPNTPQITSINFVSPGMININWTQVNPAKSWTLFYGKKSKKYIFGIPEFGDSGSRSVNVGGLKNGTYYFSLRSNNDRPGSLSQEWRVTIYSRGVYTTKLK